MLDQTLKICMLHIILTRYNIFTLVCEQFDMQFIKFDKPGSELLRKEK